MAHKNNNIVKKSIAIVTGGNSSEEVISIKSAKQIIDSLDPSKYIPYLINIKNKKWTVKRGHLPDIEIDKNDFSFVIDNTKIQFDAAFIIIHGTPGEDGKIQSYFEMLNIPYVGPKVLPASLSFNKNACKIYLKQHDIDTARCIYLKNNSSYDTRTIVNTLKLPLFVKPNEAGSSFGVTRVNNEKELEIAIRNAFNEDNNSVLIEEYIEGTEITCGIYRSKGKTTVLPVTEIVSSKDFFDYEAKYTPGMANEITPARISHTDEKNCKELTEKIYKALELSGISRIDYILKNDILYLLEVNTIPGMSKESIVPKQIKEAGLSMKDVLSNLIEDLF